MSEFTKEEITVTLYFTAMGVKSSAVTELMFLKCYTQRSLRSVRDKIRNFKANSEIYDAATSTWKSKDVGRYLRIYGVGFEFDTLISFAHDEYSIIRARQDLNDTKLKLDEMTIDFLGGGNNEITKGFYEAPHEGPQPWLNPPF